MTLDTHTFAAVSVLGGVLMAVSLGGVWLAGTRERAVAWWCTAGAALGLGFAVGVAFGSAASTWWPGALANAFVGAGHAAILVGVRTYLGRRSGAIAAFLVVAALLVSTAVSPELQASLRSRVLFQSIWYAAMDLAAGWMLWRAVVSGLTAYHRVVGAVMLVHGAFFAARWIWVLVNTAFSDAFGHDPFQAAVFPVGMVLAYALSVGLVVMLYRRKELDLREAAHRDALTGLSNRMALASHVEREMARARRYGQPLSVIALDVDHFKSINDRYGHDGGDDVLRHIGRTITSAVRDCDLAFRFGGEEFLVLLPNTSAVDATWVADRIRQAVKGSPVRMGRETVAPTISLGVTELARDEAWPGAFQRVDAALYEAKRLGRDRVFLA